VRYLLGVLLRDTSKEIWKEQLEDYKQKWGKKNSISKE
jgi:hypothetical protein